MLSLGKICLGAKDLIAWYILKGFLAFSAASAASKIFCNRTLRACFDANFIVLRALARCRTWNHALNRLSFDGKRSSFKSVVCAWKHLNGLATAKWTGSRGGRLDVGKNLFKVSWTSSNGRSEKGRLSTASTTWRCNLRVLSLGWSHCWLNSSLCVFDQPVFEAPPWSKCQTFSNDVSIGMWEVPESPIKGKSWRYCTLREVASAKWCLQKIKSIRECLSSKI